MKHSHPHLDCHICEARCRSVFNNLDKKDLDALNIGKGCSVYKKSQIVFKQGDRKSVV